MNFVKINGKKFPVKFGLLALKTMMDKYELKKLVETEDLINELEIDYIPMVLYLGVENGCKISKKEPPLLEAIELAFEANLSLLNETLELLSADIRPPEVEEEKKEPAKTPLPYKK